MFKIGLRLVLHLFPQSLLDILFDLVSGNEPLSVRNLILMECPFAAVVKWIVGKSWLTLKRNFRLPFEIGDENTKSSPKGAGGRQDRVCARFYHENEPEPGPG